MSISCLNDEAEMTDIDEVLVAQICSLLAELDGWANADISLRVLSGGKTNRNFIATINDEQFVVRVPGERTEVLGISRVHEANAARHAAQLGIAPPIAGEITAFNTLVTKFVAGEHLAGARFTERIDEVIELIKRFHDGGPIDGSFPIHRIVEAHQRDAHANGVDAPKLWQQLHEVSMRIESAFAKSPDLSVACHNDLLPTNVLFAKDRVWLIDFEYAGMNNAYFDLGNLSVNCDLDESGDEKILLSYFGEVTKQRWAKLQLMKVMSELREGMWAVVQQAISVLEEDFVEYANTRLENCRRLAGAPNFASLLDNATG